MSNVMSAFLQRLRPEKYSHVSSDSDSDSENDQFLTEKQLPLAVERKSSRWPKRSMILCLCLLTAIAGFFIGFQFQRRGDGLPVWAADIPRGRINLEARNST